MESVRAKLVLGASWLAIARFASNMFSLASILVLARILAPADFGLVAIATTIMAITSAVTELALAQALIYQNDITDKHFDTAWTLNTVRGLLVGAAFIIAGFPVSIIFDDARLITIMMMLGLSLSINGLSSPRMVVFARRLSFSQEVRLLFLSRLIGFCAAMFVAYAYQSYWAIVANILVTQTTSTIFSYVIAPYKPRFGLTHAKSIWSFSIWMTLSSTVSTINWKLDNLLVGGFLGQAALGYYTIGDRLAQMPTQELTSPIANAMFPALSRMRDERIRVIQGYRRIQTLLTAIALPAAIGFAILSDLIVLIAVGEKWLPAVQVVQILAIVFGLQSLSSSVNPLARAHGKTRELFWRDILIFFVRVPIVLVGIWFGGLIGLLYGRVISGTIGIFINLVLVKMIIQVSVREQIIANWRSIVSAIVMAVLVFFLKGHLIINHFAQHHVAVLIICTFAGVTFYSSMMYVLWVVSGKNIGPETEIFQLCKQVWIKSVGKKVVK